MKYIRCILLLLLITGESYGGSGASKVFLGVGLGVATGGAGFALGATAGTAVTAGLATTAGVIAGADTRAGVQMGGNGQVQGTFTQIRNDRGQLLADVTATPPAPVNPTPRFTTATDKYYITPRLSESERERSRKAKEERRARESFANWSYGTHYSIKFVEGLEYHVAKNYNSEFLTLGVGRGWKKSNREFIGLSHFTNQPRNLEFEQTPLRWHFDIKVIDGRRYNHAWTGTLLDFMVPEGEKHRICAPSWYIRQHEEQQRELNSRITSVLLESKTKCQAPCPAPVKLYQLEARKL